MATPIEFPEEEFVEPAPAKEIESSPVEEIEPSPESAEPSPPPEGDHEENRVLVVNTLAPTTRLIRETLENFTDTKVEMTSDFLRGFELALQKRYRLFFFGIRIGDYEGPLLYELISKAYTTGHGSQKLAPAVVFLRDRDDPRLPRELERDVRVKDVLSKPFSPRAILQQVEAIIGQGASPGTPAESEAA